MNLNQFVEEKFKIKHNTFASCVNELTIPADGEIPGTCVPTCSWIGKSDTQIIRDINLFINMHNYKYSHDNGCGNRIRATLIIAPCTYLSLLRLTRLPPLKNIFHDEKDNFFMKLKEYFGTKIPLYKYLNTIYPHLKIEQREELQLEKNTGYLYNGMPSTTMSILYTGNNIMEQNIYAFYV